MRVHILQREQRLRATPDQAFAFFADPRHLEATTPPLLRFRVMTPDPIQMRTGTLIQYRLALHGIPVAWMTAIQAWEPPARFVDVQVRGPYALWHHVHEFAADPGEPGVTTMRDTIRYAVGFGALGVLADRLLVRGDLRRILDFRAQRAPALLAGAGVSAARR